MLTSGHVGVQWANGSAEYRRRLRKREGLERIASRRRSCAHRERQQRGAGNRGGGGRMLHETTMPRRDGTASVVIRNRFGSRHRCERERGGRG